jgi:hypothetical protein
VIEAKGNKGRYQDRDPREVESRKLKVEGKEQGREKRSLGPMVGGGSGERVCMSGAQCLMCPQAQKHYSTDQLLVKQFFKWFVWYGIGEKKKKSQNPHPYHRRVWHPADAGATSQKKKQPCGGRRLNRWGGACCARTNHRGRKEGKRRCRPEGRRYEGKRLHKLEIFGAVNRLQE